MKICSFVVFLIQILFLTGQIFSQETIVEYDNFLIVENTLNVKFGNNFPKKRSLESDLPYFEKLETEFPNIKIVSSKKKFPTLSAPPFYCTDCADLSNIYEIKLEGNYNLKKLLFYLNRLPYIIYAEPALIMETCNASYNDPIVSTQYHLSELQITEAWDITKGDSSVVIGITDTGFDTDHEDLIFQIAYNYNDPINGIDDDNDGYIDNFRGWDLAMYDNDPSVESSEHGVFVAGLACAEVNNNRGIAGGAYNCKFLPVKVQTSAGNITKGYEGIVYAAEHGCSIINCSWGSKSYFRQFGADVVNYASINKGAVVVAAAGNSQDNIPWYPASFENVLSVGGTIAGGYKWSSDNSESSSGSSWGDFVDICAPAANYWSTSNNNGYKRIYGGTSFASPIVAAAAALVRSYYPELTQIQVRKKLKATADNIYNLDYNAPYIDQLGFGKINYYRALYDTTVPSINFENIKFVSTENKFFPGDTVYIYGDYRNYLYSSSNINVNIETSSQYLNLKRMATVIKQIRTDTSISNANYPFMFIINEDCPFDYKVRFKIIFSGENYRSYQFFDITVNPSSYNLTVNDLNLSFFSNGLYGYAGHDQQDGIGVLYKNKSTIYEGALVIGSSELDVVSNLKDHWDFKQLSRVEPILNPKNSDIELNSEFNDDFATSNRVNVDINHKVMAWENGENFLISLYDIVNNGMGDIEEMYAGLFFDWSIINSRYNKIELDKDRSLSYAFSSNPTTFYCGVKILNGNFANSYAIDYIPDAEPYIDITDGLNYEELYFLLTSSKNSAGNSIVGNEVANMISAGPFFVEPKDTAKFHVALIWADSKDSLISLADKAQKKYNQTVLKEQNNTNSFDLDDKIEIWPHVVSDCIYIKSKQKFNLSIVDLMGKELIFDVLEQNDNYYKINIPNKVNSGIYLLNMINSDFTFTRKIFVK